MFRFRAKKKYKKRREKGPQYLIVVILEEVNKGREHSARLNISPVINEQQALDTLIVIFSSSIVRENVPAGRYKIPGAAKPTGVYARYCAAGFSRSSLNINLLLFTYQHA